jgi:8-oxo-dGTP diphosphatase
MTTNEVAIMTSELPEATGERPAISGLAAADGLAEASSALPAIPASAGALVFDRKGRLLILKPTYKAGWTIPGGVMEADGETPWEACQREVREECGLTVRTARLAAVDFRRPKPGRPGGIRYLFDCGRLSAAELDGIMLQPEEISDYGILKVQAALPLLSGPIRRRLRAACAAPATVYLENGRPVDGIR